MQKIKSLIEEILKKYKVSDAQINFKKSLMEGDMFQTISNTELCFQNGVEVTSSTDQDCIEHKSGQILVIYIWYQGCGYHPINTLRENQAVIEEFGKEWGSKVRMIGLSFDAPSKVKEFV